MSWETDRVDRFACPCRQGDFIVEHRSDDWNRHEAVEHMACPCCNEEYATLQYSYPEDDRIEWDVAWVKQASIKELEHRRSVLTESRQRATQVFRERYEASWLRLFEGCRSKVDVWRTLKSLAKGASVADHSEEAFYRAVRRCGTIQRYLTEKMVLTNLEVVLSALHVVDQALEARRATAHRMERDVQDLRASLITEAWKPTVRR